MHKFISHLLILSKNEARLLWRTQVSFASVIFFSFLIVLMFHIGFGPFAANPIPLLGPLVWFAALFGAFVHINRSFEEEAKGQLFDTLRLIPQMALPLFLTKFFCNFIFIVFILFFSLFICFFLFNVHGSMFYLAHVTLPFILGGFGAACLGTLFSTMLISHKRRDLILPMICLPMLMPLIVGVIKSLEYSPAGNLLGVNHSWVVLLAVFDAICFLFSLYVFEIVMEG